MGDSCASDCSFVTEAHEASSLLYLENQKLEKEVEQLKIKLKDQTDAE